MTTYHDLTGFRRDCLQAIAAVDGEPYGRALQDWLDHRYSEPVNHSRLYQNLNRLAEASLVAVTDTTTADERRTVYTLTDSGERLLEAHAGEIAPLKDQGTLVADGGPRGSSAKSAPSSRPTSRSKLSQETTGSGKSE